MPQPTRIAALTPPAAPLPSLTVEDARREREAIAAALRAACSGSPVRLDNVFTAFAMGVSRG